MVQTRVLEAIAVMALAIACGSTSPPVVELEKDAKSKDIDDREKAVDLVFEEWDRPDSPGCAVAVVEKGDVVLSKGYGMADLENGVPITSSTAFNIASVSKQFTAASIALLVADGKISLDTNIHDVLPELRRYDHPVRVRDLVYHQSGIADYVELFEVWGDFGPADSYTENDILTLLGRFDKLGFEPGTTYMYSNSNYFLLAMIIRRVTGKSLGVFAKERIFSPLNMERTWFQDESDLETDGRASAYVSTGKGGFGAVRDPKTIVGDGGIFTTVDDLALWDRNFYESRLTIDPMWARSLASPGLFNDGRSGHYGHGLMVGEHRGLKMISHAGGTTGYRTLMIRFSDERLSVFCLCNTSRVSAVKTGIRVAEIYLGDRLATRPQAVALLPEQLAQWSGVYRDSLFGVVWKVQARKNKIEVETPWYSFEAVPFSKGRFRPVESTRDITLAFEKTGSDGARLSVEGSESVILEKIDPWQPSAEKMQAYAGTYRNEAIPRTLEIVVRESRLYVVMWDRKGNRDETPLEPTIENRFGFPGGEFHFLSDESRAVHAVSIDEPAVLNLIFKRSSNN